MANDKPNLRDALKTLTDQDIAYSKLCVVREKGEGDLLYHCEPIDSDSFLDKSVYKIVNNKQVRATVDEGGMSDSELEESKANWYYDCRLTAEGDINLQTVTDTSTGIFNLPSINSLVIISLLNDTDAYIAMISSTENVKIQTKNGSQSFSFGEFAEINQKLIQFAESDVIQMLTNTQGIEVVIGDLIRLKNKDNFVEVRDKDVEIQANNTNGSVNIHSDKSIILTGDTDISSKCTVEIDSRIGISNIIRDFNADYLKINNDIIQMYKSAFDIIEKSLIPEQQIALALLFLNFNVLLEKMESVTNTLFK